MIVNTPDGPVNFPDTMSQPDIEAALQKLFPPDSARSQLGAVTQGFGAEAAPAEQDQAAYDAQIRQGMEESQVGRRNEAAGAAYEALPGYLKPLQTASDILTTTAHPFAQAVTGAASMLSPGEYKAITPEMVIARLRTGKLEGPEFDAEVAKQKQATEDAAYRAGWAGTAGQIAAGTMVPIARLAAGRPLLNLAATGAAGGGLVAAGSEENPLLGAAGGVAGALGGAALGKGISMAGDKLLGALGKVVPVGPLKVPVAKPPMTKEEFFAAAGKAYDESESHGVIFNKQGLEHLKNKVKTFVTDKGYHPRLQPTVAPVLETLDDYIATGNVTQRGLQTLREMASGAYEPGNNKANMFVSKIIDEIDDLAGDLKFAVSSSGNPKVAAEAAKRARALYHKGAKLSTVENFIESGQLQGNTNITKNVKQTVRRKLKAIVDPTRPVGRGFTALEKEGVRKAISTTKTEDLMHALSGFLPRDKLSATISLGTLATGAATGAMLGGPTGALLAVPAMAVRFGIGFGAEKVAERMAQKSVDDLVHLLSTGQTTKQAAQSVLQKLTASKRAAVMQGLARAGFALAASTQPLNEPEVSSVTGRIGGML